MIKCENREEIEDWIGQNDFNFYFKCFAISGLKVFSDNFTGYKFVSAMRLILLERNAKERHISSLLL